MPHIVVKMYPTDSEAQKVKLTEELTKAIMDVTNKPADAISVSIVEVPERDWMEEVYQKDILPALDTLYKKPGY